MAATASKGKPRGRAWPKGVSGNPRGQAKLTEHERRIEKDARLLARDRSVEAVQQLVVLMRGVVKVSVTDKQTNKPNEVEVIVPPSAMIAAATAILDRGYGRPPQALEIYGGDVRPEEREGSALEILESRLAGIEGRVREDQGVKLLN